ncbi:hypothetical protein LCGC14_2221600, partial [marine sediment metagenome]
MQSKRCTKCKKERLLSEFYKTKRGKNGLASHCKTCMKVWRDAHRIEIRKYSKERYQIDRDKLLIAARKRGKTPEGKKAAREKRIKGKYGIDLDGVLLMYILQNGRCACCKQALAYDEVNIDHDHKTGKVRGLVCRRCNNLLAAFDDKIFFNNAIKYLNWDDRNAENN